MVGNSVVLKISRCIVYNFFFAGKYILRFACILRFSAMKLKLKELNDLIVFDEFPNRYRASQIIVLTHLLHLERQVLPKKLCTIMTTTYLAEKFREYCKQKGAGCLNSLNFRLVEPYHYHDIVLGLNHTLQLLFCESQEATRNLMVLIRDDGKLKCIYAGNFLDIRSALLNDTFASWLENEPVPELYLNLNRCHESPEKQEEDVIYQVFAIVKQILDCFSQHILHLHVPQFGYDNFLVQLAEELPNRLSISCDFRPYLNNITEQKTLPFTLETVKKAKILVFPGRPPSSPSATCPHTNRKIVTIHLQDEQKDMKNIEITNKTEFYTLYYSPEPSAFHLQLLCLLLKPQRLVAIIGGHNVVYKVPAYLIELCGSTTPGHKQKRGSRLGQTLRSVGELKETGKVLSYGPQLANQNAGNNLYLDDSESSD